MSDLDPRLVELLRRTPAPTALDEPHRAAVAAAARQAWFRAQIARRRSLVATLLAAGLVAGLCGFALRGAVDSPSVPVVVPLASADRPRSEPPVTFSGRDGARPMKEEKNAAPQQIRQTSRHDDAARPETTAIGVVASTPPPATTPAAPQAEAAAPDAEEPRGRRAGELLRESGRAHATEAKAAKAVAEDMAKPLAMEALQAGVAADREPAPAAVTPPSAIRSPGTIDIPADAPERGRLLAAAVVLDAAQAGRLAGADRAAALRAALASLDGLAHPAAERLRGELRSALARSR